MAPFPQAGASKKPNSLRPRAALAKDIERYLDLAANGENALSEFDRMCGYLHTSLALKHNHIAYNKGLILALEEALGPEQGILF